MEHGRWYINWKKNMQRGDWNKKRKKRKYRLKKKNVKKHRRTVLNTKTKLLLCQLWAFNIRESESFYSTKVNLVLNTHALQIILFGPIYVRTQYRFGLLQIVSLHILFYILKYEFLCNFVEGLNCIGMVRWCGEIIVSSCGPLNSSHPIGKCHLV